MISTLHIKNIGIIDDLSIDFNEGFNVLTGETGAGKTLIISSLGIIAGGRFSKEMLIHYRLNGLYDEAKFEKYKKYFKYVSDVSAEECMEIARIPVDKLRTDYANLISVEEQWDFKLEQIERNIINQSIYLYGAGLYGEKVALKLKEDGYGEYIKGILVTNTQDNKQ